MTKARWQPWQALSERPHIALHIDGVANVGGGAIYARRGDRAVIVLSPDLDDKGRRSALAHELIHDERGITSPAATDATMQSEEREVRRITARRLVPLEELRAVVRAQAGAEGITAELVAAEFGVTIDVAVEALRQMAALPPDLDRREWS